MLQLPQLVAPCRKDEQFVQIIIMTLACADANSRVLQIWSILKTFVQAESHVVHACTSKVVAIGIWPSLNVQGTRCCQLIPWTHLCMFLTILARLGIDRKHVSRKIWFLVPQHPLYDVSTNACTIHESHTQFHNFLIFRLSWTITQ